MIINKDLVWRVEAETGISHEVVERVLHSLRKIITESLAQGIAVRLIGLVTFRRGKARVGASASPQLNKRIQE